MQTSVTFKNVDPSDNLKAYVGDKLDRLDKFLDNPAEASVVLAVEKFRHIAEISINGDRLNINGKEETNDMYSAIDMVLDKIETQIKRNKQKIRERRTVAKRRAREEFVPLPETVVEDGEPALHVREIDYKPMDVEEAVLQMDLVEDNFLVFTNARSERVNVLYRRRNGGLGLIQPNT